MNPWIILDMQETTDKDKVRKAYMLLLKKTNPEDDPEGFQTLRLAYEKALASIDEKENPEDTSPVGLFMERLGSLYADFGRRIDLSNWKELLQDDVCVALETEDELTSRLFEFFSSHPFLPQYIWELLDNTFHWRKRADTLKKQFHPGFIDFIIGNCEYESTVIYTLFNTAENKDFEKFLYLYSDIGQELHYKNIEPCIEWFEKIEALGILHPAYTLEKALMLALQQNQTQAIALINEVFSQYPNEYGNHFHALYIKGAVLAVGETETDLKEAIICLERSLAIRPGNYVAQVELIATYIKLNQLETAHDYLIQTMLPEQPSNMWILSQIRNISGELAQIYEEKQTQNPDDSQIVMNLAKYYNQTGRFDDMFALLKNQKINSAEYYEYLAACHRHNGEYEQAVKVLRDAIALEPSYSVYHDLVISLKELTQYEQAVREGRAALSLNLPADGMKRLHKTYVYMGIAENYIELRQYDNALSVLAEAGETHGNVFYLYTLRAKALKEQGKLGEAHEELLYVQQMVPWYYVAYEMEAEIFCDTQNYEQVLEVLKKAEQHELKTPGLTYYKATAMSRLQSGEWEEAKLLLMQIAQEEDTGEWGVKAHYELYRMYTEKEDYANALPHIKETITRAKGIREALLPVYYLKMGRLYAQMDELDKSIEVMEEGLTHFPDEYMIMCHLGRYIKNTDIEKSNAILRRAIEIAPQAETAYDYLVMNIWNTKNPEPGLKEINHAIEKIPQSANFRAQRGSMLDDIKQYEEAVAEYLAAMHINAEEDTLTWWSEAYIYSEMAYIYSRQLNDAGNALKYYRMSAALDDSDADVHFYIGLLTRCAEKDYRQAVTSLTKALEIGEEEEAHHSYYERGLSYQLLGEDHLAKKDFDSALSLCTKSTDQKQHDTWRYTGLCHLALGNQKKALAAFNKAAKLVKTDGTPGGQCFCVYQGFAKYYLNTGEYEKALENIESAISLVNSVINNLIKAEILQKLQKN